MEQHILNRPVNLFGHIIAKFFPIRKKVILSNIEQVFGNQITEKAKNHLMKAFYSHAGRSLMEAFTLKFLSDKEIQDKVEVIGHQHLLDVAEKGQGVLVLTGHFGNWEFAPLAGISQFKQFKGHFHFIRRPITPKIIEYLLFKPYRKAGLHVITKTNALNKILDALELNHAVVFVLDQHASLVNKDGVAAEFFGKKAGTYRSLAMVSNYTKVPVVPAASYRTSDGKHVLRFYPPLPVLETDDPVYSNTLQYNQMLEKIILDHPEQWWWFHKRWKQLKRFSWE